MAKAKAKDLAATEAADIAEGRRAEAAVQAEAKAHADSEAMAAAEEAEVAADAGEPTEEAPKPKRTRSLGAIKVARRIERIGSDAVKGFNVIDDQPEHKDTKAAEDWAKAEFSKSEEARGEDGLRLAIIRVVKTFRLREVSTPVVVVEDD